MANVYAEFLTFAMFRITFHCARFSLSSVGHQRIPFNFLCMYMFSSISWVSTKWGLSKFLQCLCAENVSNIDRYINFLVLDFHLFILLRACDAWVSLGTSPSHTTSFRDHFQTCTEDNRLEWSIAEATNKSFSTDAKFVQLKGQGYKERLVCWSNICFTTEISQWILTIKRKRFRKTIHVPISETTFTADLLWWTLTVIFRSHDGSMFNVKDNLKLPIFVCKFLFSDPGVITYFHIVTGQAKNILCFCCWYC